ncbi:TetR/AcrR family transcriptional regulator [Arenibacter sp. F20364]|uniref:TetR/AcrR family transcriptional regulator n=1 Tax=Arenibacter sp. F20364 TaxID=2926415 RepID=UPI001FF6CB04|nr:TetR/AcrR family transcriptional regulator [Arenibacter sp. F20364]MCK0188988.1 TetR/AcrR family transcriptional regulator [Arenibacter sp. F20364]
MERLLKTMKIGINEKIYLKDPESSDLGKRILEHSINLINEIGFENFTFRKLGTLIGSNESSIYRYFENKHKLLLYLSSWYWGWLEYQLVLATNAITNPSEKLKKTIEIFTKKTEIDSSFPHINEVLLNRIIINEYSKSYLTKEVEQENKDGYFEIYKRLIERISQMITNVNADYKYPASLASTILEGSFHQYFLQEHFPSLTNCDENNTPSAYFNDLVFKSLK